MINLQANLMKRNYRLQKNNSQFRDRTRITQKLRSMSSDKLTEWILS